MPISTILNHIKPHANVEVKCGTKTLFKGTAYELEQFRYNDEIIAIGATEGAVILWTKH